MKFIEPWETEDKGNSFHKELTKEISKGHILYGINTKCIARRQDQDDFLFNLLDGSGRYAVVHLTWRKEEYPQWPQTEIYENFEDWRKRRMDPDVAEWRELVKKGG